MVVAGNEVEYQIRKPILSNTNRDHRKINTNNA